MYEECYKQTLAGRLIDEIKLIRPQANMFLVESFLENSMG